jgi:hypothetical protein
LLAQARRLQARYASEIQHKAGALDAGQVMAMVENMQCLRIVTSASRPHGSAHDDSNLQNVFARGTSSALAVFTT